MRHKSGFGAMVLIIVGVVFLLQNLGYMSHFGPMFSKWWPLIIIIVGFSILLRRR